MKGIEYLTKALHFLDVTIVELERQGMVSISQKSE